MGQDDRQAASSFALVIMAIVVVLAAYFAFRDAPSEHVQPTSTIKPLPLDSMRPMGDIERIGVGEALQSSVDAAYNDKLDRDAARDSRTP